MRLGIYDGVTMLMEGVAKSLLILNDHPESLSNFAFALTKCGVNIVFAKTKVEFEEKLATRPFDALLLDVVVPRTPGNYDPPEYVGVPSIQVSREAALEFQNANPGKPVFIDSAYAIIIGRKFDDIVLLEAAPPNDYAKGTFVLKALGIDKVLDESSGLRRPTGQKGRYGRTVESNADMHLPADEKLR